MKIGFDEIILDGFLYDNVGPIKHNDAQDFEVGDKIIRFFGNFTWRAEVIKKLKNGYIVTDY